jgi:hypothetical protein
MNAFEMLKEAVGMVFVEDLSSGRDPLRRRAPEADWDSMWERVEAARKLSVAELGTSQISFLMIEAVVNVHEITQEDLAAVTRGTIPSPPPPEFEPKMAFAA